MGFWKKVVAKLGTKWGGPSLNGPHGHNFWWNSKKLCVHPIENCLEIILGIEIFEKGHFLPELWTIKVWWQIEGILPCFYNNPSLFLAFTVFTSSVYFFLSIHFKPPLQKSKIPACGRVRSTDLRLEFSRGVMKNIFSLYLNPAASSWLLELNLIVIKFLESSDWNKNGNCDFSFSFKDWKQWAWLLLKSSIQK